MDVAMLRGNSPSPSQVTLTMNQRYIDVRGVRTFYREAGGEDRPVVLLHRPPTLIVWGPLDGYMPAGAARAYLRDLPDAELHLLDGEHWLLETHQDEVAALTRGFLERNVHSRRMGGRKRAGGFSPIPHAQLRSLFGPPGSFHRIRV